ncbi:MAG: TerB family tellurite resistance protein [Terriglobia bacterium]
MSIWKFLGLSVDPRERDAETGAQARASTAAETETVRKIVAQLDQLEPARARYTAAFAYLLSRVARADLHISEEETRAMERLVRERGGLQDAEAIRVVQMAKTQATLFGGTENFLVTREFNRMATQEQKLALLDCLFAVSAADESISTKEDNEIRRIVKELELTHADFIQARLKYRQHLAVLKKPKRD